MILCPISHAHLPYRNPPKQNMLNFKYFCIFTAFFFLHCLQFLTPCTLPWSNKYKYGTNTLLKPKRHSLRCHDFMVHALPLRMCTNVVDFRVMRRLCRREWNWLWNWRCVNQHSWDPWQRTRDHGVWRLTLTAYGKTNKHTLTWYLTCWTLTHKQIDIID